MATEQIVKLAHSSLPQQTVQPRKVKSHNANAINRTRRQRSTSKSKSYNKGEAKNNKPPQTQNKQIRKVTMQLIIYNIKRYSQFDNKNSTISL